MKKPGRMKTKTTTKGTKKKVVLKELSQEEMAAVEGGVSPFDSPPGWTKKKAAPKKKAAKKKKKAAPKKKAAF
jgi:bacteriocin-like protein